MRRLEMPTRPIGLGTKNYNKMPFIRRFYPKLLSHACIHFTYGCPRNQTNYHGLVSTMLDQLSYRGPLSTSGQNGKDIAYLNNSKIGG
jgi:hypothetical protein